MEHKKIELTDINEEEEEYFRRLVENAEISDEDLKDILCEIAAMDSEVDSPATKEKDHAHTFDAERLD